jgi:hypothetical protein
MRNLSVPVSRVQLRYSSRSEIRYVKLQDLKHLVLAYRYACYSHCRVSRLWGPRRNKLCHCTKSQTSTRALQFLPIGQIVLLSFLGTHNLSQILIVPTAFVLIVLITILAILSIANTIIVTVFIFTAVFFLEILIAQPIVVLPPRATFALWPLLSPP